ncbi:hypothetical protein K7W42_19425 [Deinococcus sp. HMF7604]|uniref:hypothetical protein n=1 Tax=Deinococcus betulae TaxID=2873312 RepID=UPI001CCE4652|nr:hypothetical protein [Deinococcus betulae]MBZ9753013.1 hypothetical protein [Deinococcus betulae]
MQITVQTFDGRPWLLPYPAGHKDDKLEFNRTQHQTRGSGRAFLSGAGTSKAVVMEVEIPCTARILPAQASWDTGVNTPGLITRRKELWEGVLERTERWYCGARFRQVLGVQLFDRSEFAVLRAQLLLRDPLWYLSPDDKRPRRYPFEDGLGLYPLGMLQVVDEGDGYYEVEYLGGVQGTPTTYTAPYTGLVFHPLELSYDDEQN